MYGLRLLMNVNQSDYMPTTEAAGVSEWGGGTGREENGMKEEWMLNELFVQVRIVVHEQDQEPFPDTFGEENSNRMQQMNCC